MTFTKARTALVATVLSSVTALAACGGVTVEGTDTSSDTSSSVRESTAKESTDSSTQSSASSSTRSPGSASSAAPQDQPAAEVSELPEFTVERSPAELDLLDGLKEGGVNIDGVEDQMIAAANTVCRSEADGVNNFTLDAIAGQLIAQGRVDVPESEGAKVTELIKSTAERTYC